MEQRDFGRSQLFRDYFGQIRLERIRDEMLELRSRVAWQSSGREI